VVQIAAGRSEYLRRNLTGRHRIGVLIDDWSRRRQEQRGRRKYQREDCQSYVEARRRCCSAADECCVFAFRTHGQPRFRATAEHRRRRLFLARLQMELLLAWGEA
jgi:hypothetical protein